MDTNFEKRKEEILADIESIKNSVEMGHYQHAAGKARRVREKIMNLGNDLELVESDARLKDESSNNKF